MFERGDAEPIPAAPPPRAETTPSAGFKPLPQQGVASDVWVTTKVSATKPLVLITSSDKRTRMVFSLRLEEDGFQVVECDTAEETWQRIGEGGVSMTILDTALSRTSLSSADMLAVIVSTFPGMAVVVLGVKDEKEAEQLRRTHQRLRCLQSPATSDMVARAVKELLGAQGVARQP